jgi:uracil-DNA glycosylase
MAIVGAAPATGYLAQLRAQLRADGARCDVCPLARGGMPDRPVATDWAQSYAPPVAIVGEAPGVREVMVTWTLP